MQVRNVRDAVCRCIPGFNHLPGQNTIDGCPIQDSGIPSEQSVQFQSQRPIPPRISNRIQPIITSDDPCQPSPCGVNTLCEVNVIFDLAKCFARFKQILISCCCWYYNLSHNLKFVKNMVKLHQITQTCSGIIMK